MRRSEKLHRAELRLSSSFGPLSTPHLHVLRVYLVVTTGLYAVGVGLTVFPVSDRVPLANPTGGFVAIVLGLAALAWLAYRPDLPTPATLAACIATPVVMSFHVLVNAELLCLIAVMFIAMYVRVSYPRNYAWALIAALTVASLVALAIAPAPVVAITYVIVAVAIPAATETFGRLTRALIVAACTDPLTGAFNRAGWDLATTALLTRLSASRNSRHSVTVIAIDVDDFKQLNDSHGHAAGDRFLVDLVDSACRVLPRDAIFARMGGDEFTVCIAESGGADKSQTVLTALRRLPRITLGAATAPASTVDLAELHADADAQLACGKRERRK